MTKCNDERMCENYHSDQGACKNKTPPLTKRPSLVFEESPENIISDFWFNKLILLIAIISGIAIGYSIGVNIG